jgi:hypothetical protein
MMLLTHHQGHVPGRARRAVACVRPVCTRSLWPVSRLALRANGYSAAANPATDAGTATAMVGFTTIKRPARHLDPRSTSIT